MAAPILGTPAPQFVDTNGNPLVGGLLYTYQTGTATPQSSYPTAADADAATNANSNPVVLDSNGYANGLWAPDDTVYTVVVKNSAGVTQWTADGITVDTASALRADLASTAAGEGGNLVANVRRAYNAADYAAPNLGDVTAELQAVADLLEAGDEFNLPAGDWPVAELSFTQSDIHFSGMGRFVPVSNAAVSTVIIGSAATSANRLTGTIRVGVQDDSFGTWDDVVGLELKRTVGSVLLLDVVACGVGIDVSADSGPVAYNTFTLGQVYKNKINLRIMPRAASGYANENNWIGGRFGHNSGTYESGVRHLHVDVQAPATDYPNNNKFWGPSFESTGDIYINGLSNRISDCRLEVTTTGTPNTDFAFPYIKLGANANRNIIDIGYSTDVWATGVVDLGAATRVDDRRFDLVGVDERDTLFPSQLVKVTVGGSDFYVTVNSSTMSGSDTRVSVSQPVITGNPTAVVPVGVSQDPSGTANTICWQRAQIPSVGESQMEQRYSAIVSMVRSSMFISSRTDQYPALTLAPASSAGDALIRLLSLTGQSGEIDGSANATLNNCAINGISINHPTPGTVTADRFAFYGDNSSAVQFFNAAGTVETVRLKQDAVTALSTATAALARFGLDSGTSRSINATGTINASGADYAEFERKRPDCPFIEKGGIVGFDADGLLTDRFALAVRFGIKSTAPAYVGGDSLMDEVIGDLLEPEQPEFVLPPFVPSSPQGKDETWEAFEQRMAPEIAVYAAETVPAAEAAHEEALEAYRAAKAAYEVEHASRRSVLDRIAYCGKVPVNHHGEAFAPGQYVVAVEHEGGIRPAFVDVGDLTVAQYALAVGVVLSAGADGRPVVAVKTA